MRNEDPLWPLILFILYGIAMLFRLILFLIITHIGWAIGIIGGSLSLFFLFRHLKKKNWNWKKMKNWLMKNKRPIFYLIASGITLVIFRNNFLHVLIVLSCIWGVLLVVDQIIRKVFGCRVCNAKGKLTGHNPYLDVEFEGNRCYACDGTHLVFKERSDWYNIILKTRKEIKKLKRKHLDVTKQLRRFTSEVRIGKNIKMGKLIHENDFIRDRLLLNSKDLETCIKHHQEIEKNAHIFLSIFHLKRQHKKWRKKAEDLDEDLFERHQAALTIGHDAELALKYGSEIEAFEELMESEQTLDVSEGLRLDIERATQKLKLLFKESE